METLDPAEGRTLLGFKSQGTKSKCIQPQSDMAPPPRPSNRWLPGQPTAPRGLTFWQENGTVPKAGVVENKQKEPMNTDI